ncbi:glutamyl-tRNA reductase [Candidatus Sulfurimonas marisnigri]|uniref:Glutamyl-tRNA reductase n=1 Tax=Candidatus Sulfurimonas marisnigri TaxID=2740405 RepID=A0A7S7M215_9BACT|nr:glutamyl-tRNA reductase [Candidatus Sulfurimonas marisnigri]QOY55583.1 glutamyl-tRNA reductase [Candidatus Sulfurimonas marisnigri]
MHYLNISFSHKNSTMEIREKLSYSDQYHLNACLTKLHNHEAINEVMLISTCNRMEVFSSCNDVRLATEHVFAMLSEHSEISVDELEGRADVFDDSSAIHHLFAVASSLDSIVVGETQIAGQIKDAFRYAGDHNFGGKKLARAVHHAFKCAAKVRNITDISSKPVSIASVAVSLLKSVLKEIDGKKALIIGVGEMSEITAKHLLSSGADVYVMNRTKEHADAFAEANGTKVLDYSELPIAVNEFEILFTATSAPKAIITDELIKPCDFDRYWFDMALPRDISCHKDERINLYVIDDLKNIVDENMSAREDSARMAHGIVGRSTVEFFELLDTLDVEPIIKEIYSKAFEAANAESDRVINSGYIPKEYSDQVRKMGEQVIKRFLHDMTYKMRNNSDESKSDTMAGAMLSSMKKHSCDAPNGHACEFFVKGKINEKK